MVASQAEDSWRRVVAADGAEELVWGWEGRLEPEALRGARARFHCIACRCGLTSILEDALGGLEKSLDEAFVVPVKVTKQNGRYGCLKRLECI